MVILAFESPQEVGGQYGAVEPKPAEPEPEDEKKKKSKRKKDKKKKSKAKDEQAWPSEEYV